MSNSEPPTLRDLEAPESDFKTVSNGPLSPDSKPADDITFTARDAGEMMRFMRESANAVKDMRDVTVSLANTAIADLHEMHKRYHLLKSDITANSARIQKLEHQWASIERHIENLDRQERHDG
jgi:hypothetical protein